MTAMPTVSCRSHCRWLVFIFLLVTVAHFATAMASEITIQPAEEQILINFGDASADHRIYLDNKEIWFGRDESYLIQNLTKDTLYTIVVADENLATKAIFYTETLPDSSQAKLSLQSVAQDQVDDLFRKSHLNVELFADRIELDIGFIPSDDAYLTVYRNGEKIGIIENHRYVDTHFEKNVDYDYEIHGKRRRGEAEIELAKAKLVELGLELTDDVLEYISYNLYVLGRYGVRFTDVSAGDAKDEEEMEALGANSGPAYVLRYNTFIPWKQIYAPGKINTYADGDRSYLSATSKRFRTQVDALVSFKNRGSVRSHGRTGYTVHREGKGGKIICQERAKVNPNVMHLGQVWVRSDSITWKYEHALSNPCYRPIAPSIDWDYEATVWRNGRCKIRINHDLSPAHEVYIAREERQGSEKGWRKVYSYYYPGVYPSPNPFFFAAGLVTQLKGIVRITPNVP